MNKYTARGLAESAYRGQKKVVVLADSRRDLAHSMRELSAAVDSRCLPTWRVRRAAGRGLIEFVGGGEIRVLDTKHIDLRSNRVDVVYFDFEPGLDIISACQKQLAGTAWVELVRPT